jgi:uncharacterized small protein (DUF1192 family)
MMDEAVEPRRARGQALIDLMREDLEPYGVGDLKARIEELGAEIVRTQAQLERKQAGRAAADALFKR